MRYRDFLDAEQVKKKINEICVGVLKVNVKMEML